MITTHQINGVDYCLDEKARLTSKQLAEAAGISLRKIYRMRAAGLPFWDEYSSIEVLRKWQVQNPNWQKSAKPS